MPNLTVKSVYQIEKDTTFYAQQHICLYVYAIARPSVCLSHGCIIEKRFEVRITKFSPYDSPIPLVFAG